MGFFELVNNAIPSTPPISKSFNFHKKSIFSIEIRNELFRFFYLLFVIFCNIIIKYLTHFTPRFGLFEFSEEFKIEMYLLVKFIYILPRFREILRIDFLHLQILDIRDKVPESRNVLLRIVGLEMVVDKPNLFFGYSGTLTYILIIGIVFAILTFQSNCFLFFLFQRFLVLAPTLFECLVVGCLNFFERLSEFSIIHGLQSFPLDEP